MEKKKITVEAKSTETLGIKDVDRWYNFEDDKKNSNKDIVTEQIKDLKKGDVIELETDGNKYRSFEVKEKAKGPPSF